MRWDRADSLALSGVLATIVGVFFSAIFNIWVQSWQRARAETHVSQRVDAEAGRGVIMDHRESLERQAVIHLADNHSTDTFYSAAQELEEIQRLDAAVLHADDTVDIPLPPPVAHLRF